MLNTFRIDDFYSVEEYGYQLTAYEQYGMIDEDWALNDLVINEWINDLDECEKVALWNEYCCECNRYDDMYYEFNDDFFDTYFHDNPYEAARATNFGSVNWMDRWVTFDGYGNLKTEYAFDFDGSYDEEFVDFIKNNYFEEDEDFRCAAVNEAARIIGIDTTY